MKRIIPLLAVLLLSGCAAITATNNETKQTATVSAPAIPLISDFKTMMKKLSVRISKNSTSITLGELGYEVTTTTNNLGAIEAAAKGGSKGAVEGMIGK